jgi:hypothetical protein
MEPVIDHLLEWLREHGDTAAKEGWSLFECNAEGHDDVEVQRIDDPDEGETGLAGDDVAFAIVSRADTPHSKAAIGVLFRYRCRNEILYLREARKSRKTTNHTHTGE